MEKQLTDDHIVLLRVMFNDYDDDSNERLSPGNFAKAVCVVYNSIGEPITETQAQAITEEYDDGTGYYDFDKFVTIVTKKMVQTYTRPEMLKLFRAMDTEYKGYVTADEMRQSFGDRWSEDEIQAAVRCGAGTLTFENFYTLMNPFKN